MRVAVEAFLSGFAAFCYNRLPWSAVQRRAKPTFLIGHSLIENEKVIVPTHEFLES